MGKRSKSFWTKENNVANQIKGASESRDKNVKGLN